MLLYHATFRANLKSIKELGLGAKQPKNWEISESGVVCFAVNANIAYSYAEVAEDVSDYKYNSGIVVLAVDTTKLIRENIEPDKNIRSNKIECYTYRGVISPEDIFVVKCYDGVVGKLMELKRIPGYF